MTPIRKAYRLYKVLRWFMPHKLALWIAKKVYPPGGKKVDVRVEYGWMRDRR